MNYSTLLLSYIIKPYGKLSKNWCSIRLIHLRLHKNDHFQHRLCSSILAYAFIGMEILTKSLNRNVHKSKKVTIFLSVIILAYQLPDVWTINWKENLNSQQRKFQSWARSIKIHFCRRDGKIPVVVLTVICILCGWRSKRAHNFPWIPTKLTCSCDKHFPNRMKTNNNKTTGGYKQNREKIKPKTQINSHFYFSIFFFFTRLIFYSRSLRVSSQFYIFVVFVFRKLM